jgi:hypothetical protein
MTLQEFGGIVQDRIPTPKEFVSVVRGQGWDIVSHSDGKASLRVHNGKDALAIAFARMLGREPYRTNVLLEISAAMDRKELVESKPALPPEPQKPKGKHLAYYRMRSGQLFYRIEEEREKPPYGADAWGETDKGPWHSLPGAWSEVEGVMNWRWDAASGT